MTIIYFILAIACFVGVIRVMFLPYTGIVNLFMEMMLIDWLIDGISWCFESITELWDED